MGDTELFDDREHFELPESDEYDELESVKEDPIRELQKFQLVANLNDSKTLDTN